MQNDTILAGYGEWSWIIGGILKAAGVGGFLGNRDVLEQTAAADIEDPLRPLYARAWELSGEKECGAVFRIGNPERIVGDAANTLKGRPVYSILHLLNGDDAAGGGDTIEIPHWGYAQSDDGIRYGDWAKSKVSQRFNQLPELVKSVDGTPLQFVKLGTDKHSAYYALRVVEETGVQTDGDDRRAA